MADETSEVSDWSDALVSVPPRTIFKSVWMDKDHPRFRQYHDAITPALWACRCDPDKMTNEICPMFAKRYEIYALLGEGGSAHAFAARRLSAGGGTYDHFAVKIVKPSDDGVEDENEGEYNDAGEYVMDIPTSDPNRERIRVRRRINVEAAMQALFAHGVSNIPRIIEVYDHSSYLVIVMDLVAVQRGPEMDTQPVIDDPEINGGERSGHHAEMPPCNGEAIAALLRSNEMEKRPLDREREARSCMVFRDLLQALHHIFDRGGTHNDIAHRNIMVDGGFRGYLIDFGQSRLYDQPEQYQLKSNPLGQPDCDDPEWLDPKLAPPPSWTGQFIPNDARRSDLWRFSKELYGFLHDKDPMRYEMDNNYSSYEFESPSRALPLNVSEDLSQDGTDLLHASWNVLPHERPTIEELCTFPWFSGWQHNADVDFVNPEVKPLKVTHWPGMPQADDEDDEMFQADDENDADE